MISLRSDTRKVNRSQGTYFLLTPLHGLLLYVEEEKYEMEMKISLSYSPSPVSQDATPRPCACASVPVFPFPMPPADGQMGGGRRTLLRSSSGPCCPCNETLARATFCTSCSLTMRDKSKKLRADLSGRIYRSCISRSAEHPAPWPRTSRPNKQLLLLGRARTTTLLQHFLKKS